MFRLISALLGVTLLAGCSTKSAARPTLTPTALPTAPPRATATATARPAPTSTVVVDRTYLGFVRSICGGLATGNANAITDSLMYYQYNSGLRWGMLGDGEGHTSDPSLVSTWLASTRPRCVSFSSGAGGHGNVLTSGWVQPAAWGIVELDNVNGHWKINDFTFGSQGALAHAMQVSRPIIQYHA